MFDFSRNKEKEAFRKEARKIQLGIFPGVLEEFASGFHTAENKLPELIYTKILESVPLEFVGFWGVGGKINMDQTDLELIHFYEIMRSRIVELYKKGINLRILLADVHGRFNGYEPQPYLDLVQAHLAQVGIQSQSLGGLYESWGLELPGADESIDSNSPIFKDFFSPNAKYKHAAKIMISNARKHNLSRSDPEVAAFQYVQMRLQETSVLERTYPNSVLLVHSSKDLAMPVLPRNMPHMYLKVRPVWFT